MLIFLIINSAQTAIIIPLLVLIETKIKKYLSQVALIFVYHYFTCYSQTPFLEA